MLSKVSIKNFKSLRDVQIDLTPLLAILQRGSNVATLVVYQQDLGRNMDGCARSGAG